MGVGVGDGGQSTGTSTGGKTGATYSSDFLDWVKKNFPGMKYDPSSWEEEARKIAAGIIDPQSAAITRGIAAKKAAAESFGQTGIGVGKALGEMFGPLADRMRTAFGDAADRIVGYSGGLTGAVGAAAQDEAAKAAAQMANLRAPGGIPSQMGAAMNVANYLGGYLPGKDLASEAANRTAQMAGLGMASQAGIAQQTLMQMRATEGEINELINQGVDLERTRPAEIAKALLQVRGQWSDDMQTAFAAWKADRDEKQTAIENDQWAKTYAAAQKQQRWTNARTTRLDKAQAAAAAAREKREAAAFKLQVQDYMRKSGMDAWSVAKQLSDQTGWVYKVGKDGLPYQTNQHTVDFRTNQQRNARAKEANRIRQDQATAAKTKAAKADKTKGTGKLTQNQVVIRENDWIADMSSQVDKTLRLTDPFGSGKKRPASMPPKKADLVRKIYSLMGNQLVGKVPRWDKTYLISLINAYINTLPNSWWDPVSYMTPEEAAAWRKAHPPKKKKK